MCGIGVVGLCQRSVCTGSDASALDEVVVRYGGKDTLTSAAVHLSAASPTLTATIVERSQSAGLSLFSSSFPTVSGCDFRDNELAVTGVAIRP